MPTQEELSITYEELHESLWRYARWKSSHDHNKGHWLLNKEDLYSEYLMVMYNCHQKYASRENMTLDELMIICKSGMRNKFHSMLTKIFQTHRIAEKGMKELDDVDRNVEIPGGIDPSITRDEEEIFSEIESNLNSFDAKVFHALIGNDARVGMFLELHRRRMSFCADKSKDMKIDPHIIATALCESEHKITTSLQNIKTVLQKRDKYELCSIISNNTLIWI